MSVLFAVSAGSYIFQTVSSGESPQLKPDGSRLPSREALWRQLYRSRKVLLIYGTGDPESAPGYRQLAEEMEERSRWIRIEPVADRDLSGDSLPPLPTLVIGIPRSNAFLARWSDVLPFRFGEKGFAFHGQVYADSTDLFSLVYPHPEHPQYPLMVVSGNDDRRVQAYLRSHGGIWGIPGDYRILRGETCMVMGFFSQQPERRWQFDAAAHRDFAAETRLALETPHYRLFLHGLNLSEEELAAWQQRQEASYDSLCARLEIPDTLPVIDYHLYASFEDKGLITGRTRLWHVVPERNEVHVAVEPGIGGDDFTADAVLILRRALGQPRQNVLEMGLSMLFSRNWRGRGYAYWAARLFRSRTMPPLSDLLDNSLLERESELVMAPAAASFVACLVRRYGWKVLRQRYRTWQPSPGEVSRLNREWQDYLKFIAAGYEQAIAADRRRFPRPTGFQKGFCFAHEGYRIYNGYLSRKADAALKALADIGTNAVSITPFSYMPDPHRPVFLRYSRGPGSENDESIIHAALTARRLGMQVMLKPHIWLGRSWPGEIAMTSPEDWERFFHYYYRWMRHYALMAEMYQMEYLCVGVELSQAALQQPERWVELIHRLRGLYSGQMTYAANWGEEFENLTFWKELDFMGLNCYYPLSRKDDPTDAELLAGMEAVARGIEAVARRVGKPVVLTEIGFTATEAPWKNPHRPAGRDAANPAHQARCYRAAVTVLEGQPWLKGIYWWKWPTYLEYGGPQDNDFTPNGKPALDIVARWYSRISP